MRFGFCCARPGAFCVVQCRAEHDAPGSAPEIAPGLPREALLTGMIKRKSTEEFKTNYLGNHAAGAAQSVLSPIESSN